MGKLTGRAAVNADLAAVSRAVYMPMDDINGYVIVAVTADERLAITTNVCCVRHMIEILQGAIDRAANPDAPGPVTG